MFIYAITNDVNDKVYVGLHSGRDLQKRWVTHRSFAKRGSRSLISRAILKHGEDKFHITSIWSGHIPLQNLKQLERYFIRCFNTRAPNGYNLTAGGDGTFGYRHTPEERGRRSERMRQQIASGNIVSTKGKMRPLEVVRKIITSRTGKKNQKPVSDETRKKWSESRRGNKNALGYKQSPETIAKSVAGHAGWRLGAEHHRRLVEGSILHNTGKKASEETKRKMSEAQKARWEIRRNDARTNRGSA
jgi:group I intron endonuclease